MTVNGLIRVVVGTDHTAGSKFAVGWATDVASAVAADLVVTKVYFETGSSVPEEAAFEHLDAVTHQLMSETAAAEATEVCYSLLPVTGDPARVLHELNSPDGLLVIGANATGKTALGSVGKFVAGHLAGPLALVPGPTRPIVAAGLIIGVDGSHANDVALRWSAEFAIRSGCRLTAVYGDHPLLGDDYRWRSGSDVGERTAEEHVRSIAQDDLDLRFVNIHAKAVDALQDAVDRLQPAAVVVGTRGFGGLHGNILGSVASRLLHEPPCPVVLIPH